MSSVAHLKLEVVVLPISDVDRAKGFYEGLGWRLDADFATGPDFRVVQLTPPGSPASIIFGTGITSAEPGSIGALQLTVSDIDAAREQLNAGGADVSEVSHDEGGVFHHGNGWMLREINTRLPGRVTGATFGSPAELTQALERAKDAHTEHEQRTGEADADWPAWYAEYMVKEQTGQELPT